MKKLIALPLLMAPFFCFAQSDPQPFTDGLGRQNSTIWSYERQERRNITEKQFSISISVSPEEFKNEKFMDSLKRCGNWANELACTYNYTLITITIKSGPFRKKEITFRPAMVYHTKE
jgi:hypothetical protein